MTVSLNAYAAGDTNYVTKMNSDNVVIEAALNAQEGQITAAIGGTGVGGGAGHEIWKESGIIGLSSFILDALNSDTGLSFASGSVWFLGEQVVGRNTAKTLLQFAGKGADTYHITVDITGNMLFSTVSSQHTLYEVDFGAPSFTVLTRVSPYLFDGGDYQSAVSTSLIFTSVVNIADRLGRIEDLITIDAQFAQHTISGLTWDFKSGRVRTDGTILSAACATITLSTAATYYIEVDPTTASVSFTSEGGFTNSFVPLRVISTAGGAVLSNADVRTWAVQTFSGGGAGVLANSGTPDLIWKYNRGNPATGSDAALAVIRPDDTDVAIRWNETGEFWEWTNDGTSYAQFGNIANLNIGAGQNARFVPLLSHPLVIDETAIDATSDPADAGYPVITVSTHTSTTTTAIMLRGYVLDSGANTMTLTSQYGIQIGTNSADFANNAGGMIFASPISQFVATTLVTKVSTQNFQYRADAASDLSMTIKVALVGYWDVVQGVGTQRVSAATLCGVTTNICANVSTNFYELSFADFSAVLNRGLITYMQFSGTMPAGSLYDVRVYNSNLADPDLLFEAINIDASAVYTTRMPFAYEDNIENLKFYLVISNNGLSAGLMTFEMRGERYA